MGQERTKYISTRHKVFTVACISMESTCVEICQSGFGDKKIPNFEHPMSMITVYSLSTGVHPPKVSDWD